MGFQTRSSLMKNENGDCLQIPQNFKNCTLKNNYSQLWNIHNVSNVGQTEIHTAEPLVSGSSRMYKSSNGDQILAELIHT
jgi:hypothetical protein